MIKVKIIADEKRRTVTMTLRGHATNAPEGQNLICAGASMLTTTFAQWVKNYCDMRKDDMARPTIKLGSGNAKIRVFCPDDRAYNCVMFAAQVVGTGFSNLAGNYPDQVEFSM